MQKVYVCGNARLVVSVRNNDCWIELTNRKSSNPSLRANIYEYKYGRLVVNDENDRIRCSSGVIGQNFMEELDTFRAVAKVLEFNHFTRCNEEMTFEHMEAVLNAARYVEVKP